MGEGNARAAPVLTRLAGGEMAERVRAFDWSRTSIGALDAWSPSLRLAVDMILATNFPMALRWGPDFVLIYNDAYAPALRGRHPEALGARLDQTSPDFQASIRAFHEDILTGASGGFAFEKMPLKVMRGGAQETGYFTISYSPVPDATARNGVGGVLVTAVEVSQSIADQKTLKTTQERYEMARGVAGVVGAWEWDIPANKVYADARYAELHNVAPEYAEAGLPVQSYTPAVHPEDRERVRDIALSVAATGGDFSGEYRLVQADGSIRWVYTRGRAYLGEDGQPARNTGVVVDITERREAMDLQLRQEETLRLAIDAADVGTWDLDLDTGALTWSDRCYQMFGLKPGEPVDTETAYALIHPADAARVRDATERAMDPAIRADYAVEYRAIGRDDHLERWLGVKGKVFFGDDGKPHRFVGAVVNVTDRKRAELHLRLLVNELNHRVKNSLATIQAIAAQSFNGQRSLDQAQEAFSNRIVALAEAHDLLTRENWEGAELHDVTTRVAALHGGPGRFELSGPSIRLSPKTALSLSMALHELATNAMKYGALSTPEGRVRVAWDLAPEPGAARLDLSWSEHGGPPVIPPTERGFGSRLIERGLAAELSGSAAINFHPDGVVCRIRALLEA